MVEVAVDPGEVLAGDEPFAELVLEHAEVVNATAASKMTDTRRRIGKAGRTSANVRKRGGPRIRTPTQLCQREAG